MRLLLVEDERKVASFIARALRENSYAVDVAETGERALELGADVTYDAILLDVRLPGLSGVEVCRELRQQGIEAPVMMLTARGLVEQRVEGLDAGADDYLTKPFSFNELLARLRAVQRRATARPQNQLQVSDLILDPESRDVSRAGVSISLTRTEYSLLERLMYRAGKVVPRRALIESVWGFDREIEDNTLDAFVRLLRQKVDREGLPKLILTVRGVGYMIREEPAA